PALARLVGQTIMTGFSGRHPSAALLQRIRRGEIGGVILFRGNLAGAAGARALVARLQAAAAAGGNPPLLVALDQEGGGCAAFPTDPRSTRRRRSRPPRPQQKVRLQARSCGGWESTSTSLPSSTPRPQPGTSSARARSAAIRGA